MPKSIYSTFKGLHKGGTPLDFLAIWKKTFEKATEREVTLFQKTYSDNWFAYATPQMSLTAAGVQGKYNIRFMATLLADESPTPLRRSDGFDIWTNEIPRVGHKFFMSSTRLRRLQEVYENPRLNEAQKVREIERTLVADIEEAYLGCKDVMDFIALTALSNWGVAKFQPDINNPGGRTFEIDYNMPDENKIVAGKLWNKANSTAGNLDVILQLNQIITYLKERGIAIGEMLMSEALHTFLRMDAGIRTMVYGNDKKAKFVTETDLQTLLDDNGLPPITRITRKMAIDKDGKREPVTPWNSNMIAFKPAGVIGEIQPAIEDSELIEEPDVDYVNAGNGIRIAKWRTGESTGQQAGEYTQGSGRLLPIISDINGIAQFQVLGFAEKTLPADKYFWLKNDYDAAT
ncbi:MAG: hypothetical protein LBE04_01855 [Prevotellaceae bacterium]|jgi:hypothetical protein|nr:hypothetical protein [Prevotellaceae bacterium]